MEPVVSDLCTAGTVGGSGTRVGRRTGRRTAAVRDTESRSGLIPLPEAAVSGVRKQGWNSSSLVLELCPYLPHCTATEGCRRSLKEGPSSRRDAGLSEHGAVWGGEALEGSQRPLPATPPGGPSCARRARELASDRGSVGCRFRGEVAKDRAPLPPCPPLCLLWRRGTAARRLRATGHQPVRPSPGYRCGDAWEPILPPLSAGVTLALADAVAAAS